MRRLLSAALLLFSVQAQASERAPYPLDDLPRTLEVGAQMPCEGRALPLVSYRGERLPYQKPLRVHSAFRPQLVAFEEIVTQVARVHYGRTPRRIVHLGGYACRRMRRYPTWLSEHAIGNAVDVAGFDFGPLARGETLPDGAPRGLKGAFEVRLERHWNGGKGLAAQHSAFLRDLAHALIARPDVFNVVLGPAWPGHHNHFHLDHAPYRVVEVFAPGES